MQSYPRYHTYHFGIAATKNTSLDTVLTVLFDFFKPHLPTRKITFQAVVASIIKPIAKWIKKEKRNCLEFCFRNPPDDCGFGLDVDDDPTKMGNLLAESVALTRVRFLEVKPMMHFSAENTNLISQSVTHFHARSSIFHIKDEDFCRWSPSHFIVSPNHENRLSDEAVLAWIVAKRRSPGDHLYAPVSRECYRHVCCALQENPDFAEIEAMCPEKELVKQFFCGRIGFTVQDLTNRISVNF